MARHHVFIVAMMVLVQVPRASAETLATAERPHIVVYLSDDHSLFDTGLFGAADIPTPQMQQLAAEGVVFTHAFVASPSCAPSRAAMLTGLMPARNGAEANHTYPREGTRSLIANLKQAGYRVAAFGKVAHGKAAEQFGFEHVVGTRRHDELLREARNYLDRQPAGQPICLFVGTSNPHVSWPEETSFDPAQVKLPPIHLDTPATRKNRAAYYQEIKDLDTLLGDLRQLARAKLGENVLFIHSSDHGSQWPFGKWNLYDYGTRVPFLAAWPGKIKADSRSDALISWIDLIPTLLDAAGAPPQPDIDGRSFLPVLLGQAKTHRDRIFSTHSGDGVKNIYPIRAVRDAAWKLIHNLRPELAHTNHSDNQPRPLDQPQTWQPDYFPYSSALNRQLRKASQP